MQRLWTGAPPDPVPETTAKLPAMKSILSLLLFCCVVASSAAAAKTPVEVPIGGTLREATMQGLDGPQRKLSEFRGRPMIINVWASWCGPCRQEMGSLTRLARSKLGKQVTMIGISTDDYPNAAKAFVRQAKTGFNHFIDRQLEMETMLGAGHLPLTLLIDAQGRVLDKYYGAQEWDSPEAMRAIAKTLRLTP